MPARKSQPPSITSSAQASGPVLPDKLVDALLLAAAPAVDDEARKAQARARHALLQRIAEPGPAATRTVRAVDASWQRCLRGVERLVVDDAGPMHTWLLRLAPGASLPAHGHDHGDEESFILSGSCILNGELLHAGDYHHAGKGSHHDRLVSAEGCVLWLHMPAQQARAMIPAAAF